MNKQDMSDRDLSMKFEKNIQGAFSENLSMKAFEDTHEKLMATIEMNELQRQWNKGL